MTRTSLAGFAPWVLLAALWGCTTTTTTTSSPPTADSSRTTSTPEQVDAERRARVRMELASGYYARGQLETALDEVKLALAAKPDLPEAYNLRGLIYQSLGDDRLAEENFRRALQLNPGDPNTMHNYGWFLCQRQRLPEAQVQFQQAIATPRYAGLSRSLMTQGICYTRAGSLVDAERSLARAYELDPRIRSPRSTWPTCCTGKANTNARASTSAASTRCRSFRTRRPCGWRRASKTSRATARAARDLRPPAAQPFSAVAGSRSRSKADASMTDDASAASEARNAGAMLRAARERQGLHIAALAAAIKVPQAKLEALEAGRYDELTDATFVRALAQSVCRVLKIDAKPVLDLMPSARTSALDRVAPVRRTPFHDKPGREEPTEPRVWHQPVFWMVAVLLVAAGAFVLWPQHTDVLVRPGWRSCRGWVPATRRNLQHAGARCRPLPPHPWSRHRPRRRQRRHRLPEAAAPAPTQAAPSTDAGGDRDRAFGAGAHAWLRPLTRRPASQWCAPASRRGSRHTMGAATCCCRARCSPVNRWASMARCRCAW